MKYLQKKTNLGPRTNNKIITMRLPEKILELSRMKRTKGRTANDTLSIKQRAQARPNGIIPGTKDVVSSLKFINLIKKNQEKKKVKEITNPVLG